MDRDTQDKHTDLLIASEAKRRARFVYTPDRQEKFGSWLLHRVVACAVFVAMWMVIDYLWR